MLAQLSAPLDLPLEQWRCGACGSPLRLLGTFTVLGGVHLYRSRNQSARGDCPLTRHIILDLAARTVAVHCGACHDWRALRYGDQGDLYEERWDGARPDGACRA